jgi:hypothetical protein
MNNSTSRPLTTGKDMSFAASSWIPPRPAPAEGRLSDDVERFALPRSNAATDEVIVPDERSALTPSQAVENRLVALLREATVPVSHLQLRGPIRRGRAD